MPDFMEIALLDRGRPIGHLKLLWKDEGWRLSRLREPAHTDEPIDLEIDRGTDPQEGVNCLLRWLETLASDQWRKASADDSYLSSMLNSGEPQRPGFRPGWAKKQLIDLRNGITKMKNGYLQAYASLQGMAPKRGWPEPRQVQWPWA